MKKQINLNSQEWCDIVFKDKNKSYGAYEMRMSSSKRHIVAFGVVILLTVAVALLPMIMNKVSAANKNYMDPIDMERVMSEVLIEQPIEEIIEMAVPEPPKIEHVRTIKFTPPVIGTKEEVGEIETPPIEEILHSNAVVGRVDNPEGTDDRSAPMLEEPIIMDTPVKKIFDIVEVMPQFPGGNDEMMRYVGATLRYPVVDQENGTQGRVTVRFVVTKDGNIDQVEVLRGISPTCDREAIRVVKSMPKWIPGRQNGKAVAVYFTLPVLYKLR